MQNKSTQTTKSINQHKLLLPKLELFNPDYRDYNYTEKAHEQGGSDFIKSLAHEQGASDYIKSLDLQSPFDATQTSNGRVASNLW